MKYNLPHVTSYDFVAYSHVPLVNVADLKKKGIPNNNFWSKYGNLTVDQLVDKLDKDLHILRDYNVATKGYTLDPRNRLAESPYDYKQEATAAPATNVNVSMLKSSGASTLIEQSKRRLAELVTGGYMPVVIEKASGKEDVIPVPPPPPENERTPKLFIVLHYKMTTFLGDYGAGEVVKTMSLLPGEKTTISIKNYTNTEETRKKAESVLDSYSQSSADEFQKMVDYASEYHSGMNRSESVASTNTFNAGVSGSISLGLIFGSMDFNASYGYTGTQSSSLNTTVQNQAKLMNNITNTHVAKADSNRKIEVNSEATSKITTGSEEVIIREIENINKSRTVNYVFRQLLQEYITLTYLYDVSFVYADGYMENRKTATLEQLDDFLKIITDNNQVAQLELKKRIIRNISNITDYNGQKAPCGMRFIQQKLETLEDCPEFEFPPEPQVQIRYIRKNPNFKMTYGGYTVPGIIVDVQHRTVRTPSLIVDAVLGQGEALDCYNMNLQKEAVRSAVMQNDRYQQLTPPTVMQMNSEVNMANNEANRVAASVNAANMLASNILNDMNNMDPTQRAAVYKTLFEQCCPVCSCNPCGCHNSTNSNG